ncbi:hypothetical protein PanWU01x14_256020 [Parasponia andersonii]|uniref:Uncharacterized protein n=1 Tax=Parasponia andersonii TaxID=3476 RepID=A0A2P5BAL8_PARAD|nr:hypothetical protein PanWU01x14_256020 [Parasponia andersonii]
MHNLPFFSLFFFFFYLYTERTYKLCRLLVLEFLKKSLIKLSMCPQIISINQGLFCLFFYLYIIYLIQINLF